MAKLQRLTNKIFGDTANTIGENPDIGQFGSALDGTFVGTGDVEAIQQKSAWSKGWINAVTANQQYPALPEMTGVMKVFSHQTGYILQEGIPEYDANTVYFKGSLVKVYDEQTQKVVEYISITDNNQNNPLTDTYNWKLRTYTEIIDVLNIIYPVGSIYLTINSTCPIASMLGTWVLVSSGKALWTGNGSNGGGTISAGLPNITGRMGNTDGSSSSATGCFYRSGRSGKLENSGGEKDPDIYFDASRSSSIYGASSTVQPPAYIVNAFRRIS